MTRQNPPALRQAAFTIVELLVVIVLILLLAGLILGASGYAQNKGRKLRAATEIAAISTALEDYRADNGVYPIANVTNTLDAQTMFNPESPAYEAASAFLYTQLSGDHSGNRVPSRKVYFDFKPNMLLPRDQAQTVTAIADPFGNSYGYSTANQADSTRGYNPTFDLWSTAGTGVEPLQSPPAIPQERWIKNW